MTSRVPLQNRDDKAEDFDFKHCLMLNLEGRWMPYACVWYFDFWCWGWLLNFLIYDFKVGFTYNSSFYVTWGSWLNRLVMSPNLLVLHWLILIQRTCRCMSSTLTSHSYLQQSFSLMRTIWRWILGMFSLSIALHCCSCSWIRPFSVSISCYFTL